MKLVIVSQYYPPEIGAPQARLSELAREFVARGHVVKVLTGMPNYPTGRIHPGYGGLLRRETREGVPVVRTYIHPVQSAAVVPRLANYLSFAGSAAAIGPAVIGKADYVMVESPPLFLGPSGWWLSRWTRARFIFNVSDLWPESAVRLGLLRPSSRAHQLASALERFCYRRAWLVTGQSRSIIEDLRSRFPSLNLFHLSNGADTTRFRPEARREALHGGLSAGRETVVLYAGLHGLAQGLNQVLDAAAGLVSDRRLRFVLVGDGPEKAALQRDAEARNLDNVAFESPKPFNEMPALLASADVILVSLKAFIPGAVPSKLYEAMASGRPVVLIGSGEPADIVRQHRAGIVVEPGDAAGLEEAIRTLQSRPDLRSELGAAARAAAVASFDRHAICGRFIDHLESALEGQA